MQKMTIADAAEFFGVSKEAIHNRVRRGSLESEIIDGEKHVFVDENNTAKTTQSTKKPRTKSSVSRVATPKVDDRYYNLLQEQNTKLQEKVEKLEGETRTLRDQKEQMLIDERKKIEQIYKDKDEQLKNILNAISSKFMLTNEIDAEVNEIDVDILDDSSKENGLKESNLSKDSDLDEEVLTPDEQSILTSLNKYLKVRDFSKKKRQKIKAKFEKNSKSDKRVIMLNNKLYIDLGKYSYSDYSL